MKQNFREEREAKTCLRCGHGTRCVMHATIAADKRTVGQVVLDLYGSDVLERLRVACGPDWQPLFDLRAVGDQGAQLLTVLADVGAVLQRWPCGQASDCILDAVAIRWIGTLQGEALAQCKHPHIHEVGEVASIGVELWCGDCGAVFVRDTGPLAGYVRKPGAIAGN